MILINNIILISKSCNTYPQKLLKINNSPDIIFAIGNLSLLNTFSLAIVGARNYTLEAKTLTISLVKELVNQNITIVSGMARGIDSIAHEACINANGHTIAIAGSGLLDVKHQKIFNKILENNGLIISEFFPDTPAYKSNFPKRNRLVSGISDGIIIPQARIKSGSLITAKYASIQNKPIFTFPWNIDNENYSGNIFLLTHDAKCIASYEDILKYYPNFKTKKKNLISIPNEFIKIYSKLKYTPTHINQLCLELNAHLSELQYKLTLMELEDLVLKLPNDYFVKKHS